jgi:hypothetical protein
VLVIVEGTKSSQVQAHHQLATTYHGTILRGQSLAESMQRCKSPRSASSTDVQTAGPWNSRRSRPGFARQAKPTRQDAFLKAMDTLLPRSVLCNEIDVRIRGSRWIDWVRHMSREPIISFRHEIGPGLSGRRDHGKALDAVGQRPKISKFETKHGLVDKP